MLPSAEAAAQELMFKSLQNISLQLFVCVLFACSFLSLSSRSLSSYILFCFYVLFCCVLVWIRTPDWLFRTTGCLCTVVGLTTAPSFAQEH